MKGSAGEIILTSYLGNETRERSERALGNDLLQTAKSLLVVIESSGGSRSTLSRNVPLFIEYCKLLNIPQCKNIGRLADRIFSLPFDKMFDKDRMELIDQIVGLFSAGLLSVKDSADTVPEQKYLVYFELTEADREKIGKLCAQMTGIVRSSSEFDDGHRRRLLRRISAIEVEIFQKRGMLDVVLAGVLEISETLGTVGREIKPLTDRIIEIATLTKSRSTEPPLLEDLRPKQLPEPEEEGLGDS